MVNKTKRNKKNSNNKTRKKTYSKKDFKSKDGMLTSVWGPSLWHYLHTMSFNYPINPTIAQKKYYKQFILSLKYVLPCKYCRMNLRKNLRAVPLTETVLKNRDNFSKWMYDLHEQINKMLNKNSCLTYEQVRERYEHFRARCSKSIEKKTKVMIMKRNRTRKINKEKGCTEPLFGEKSKCIIKIVPQKKKCKTFQMDNKCIKKRI